MKRRIFNVFKFLFALCLLGALFIFIYNIYYISPLEKNLQEENSHLKKEYDILSHRLENVMEVVDKIAERDDNFYRVMMQMEPVSNTESLAGLSSENRYRQLSKLSDEKLIDELNNRMNILETMIASQIISFEQLGKSFKDNKDKLAHIPSVLPINIKDYTMSSGFGWRNDPILETSKFHAGLDFAASMGTDVYATGKGKVVFAGQKTDYGNCIDIDHGYGYLTRYAHLSEILVKNGQQVIRGQLIGKVGSTGKSTGPHLHYEVRYNNEPQNPVNYYFLDVTPEQYYEMVSNAEKAGLILD